MSARPKAPVRRDGSVGVQSGSTACSRDASARRSPADLARGRFSHVSPREFDAPLEKGDNPGAWTCVVMDDVSELFGTRGLVKIRGTIDGEPFDGALMAQGDGTHRLPVRAKLRQTIGKEAGDTVHVRIDERIG
jgi:uncharacterized protein DUF1905